MWHAELGPDAVRQLAFTPGGRHLLACDAVGRLLAFDTATQDRTELNPSPALPVRDFALTPAGSTLLLLEGLYGRQGGYWLGVYRVSAPPGEALALARVFGESWPRREVGRLLLAAGGAEVYLADRVAVAPPFRARIGPERPEPLEPPPLRGERPAAANAAGTLIAWPARDTDRVTVWDTLKDWRVRTVVLDAPGVALALSDAGCVAVLKADGGVRLYHPGARSPVVLPAVYETTPSPAKAAFSAAGDRVAVYNVAKSVEVWRADTGELLGRHDWGVGRVTAAASRRPRSRRTG